MATRLETECQFLYRLALCEKKEFIKAIKEATPDELAAIVEVALNKDIFVPSKTKFNVLNFLPNIRINVVRNRNEIQKLLCTIFHEIISAEKVIALTAEQEESD